MSEHDETQAPTEQSPEPTEEGSPIPDPEAEEPGSDEIPSAD